MNFSPDELQVCLRVLQEISESPAIMNDHQQFKTLVAKIHRQGKKERRQAARECVKVGDRRKIEKTGIVRHEINSAADAAAVLQDTLTRPISCYICKRPFTQLHFHYHQLCPACARFNWERRGDSADLSNRVAIVTGGRVKIGFQVTLKLLRDGARVLATTRFPQDAARRFAAEADFAQWQHRLQICGLDLRDLPSVEEFAARLLKTEPHLDILVHNAAQTIKRPLAFYQHLLEDRCLSATERALIASNEDSSPLLEARPDYRGGLPAQISDFPPSVLDWDGQQADLRSVNSWRLKIGEISTVEMLEVFLVNAAAPFVLTNRLLRLLCQSPNQRRFVVNVSAMEGQFSRVNRTPHHPHTNMAKAALNMLTRTTAQNLARDGIYINSVDTGWITDEKPFPAAERARIEHGFYAPLDVVDGAARIYDPIVRGMDDSADPLYGHFLKDYSPYPW